MMNFRNRVIPPLPDGYFGNAVYCICHKCHTGALFDRYKDGMISEWREFTVIIAIFVSLIHNDLAEQVCIFGIIHW
jgi:hypothetical protein